MTEMDLLDLFYQEIKTRGTTRDKVFLNINEDMVVTLNHFFGHEIALAELQSLADVCIVNEWLTRTTNDPYYNFISLTEKGLKVLLKQKYGEDIE